MRRILLFSALVALAVPLASLAGENPPVITVPADMTVEAQSFSGATVTYTATAVDWRGQPLTVTCAPPPGSGFPFGRTTVSCTARDSQGRTSTKRFHITVVDTQPPVITVPPSQTISTTSRSGKAFAYTATATDVVDGPVAINCYPAPGVVFPVGTTTVNCAAADRRGNASAAAFTVTVVFTAPKRTAKSTTMLAPKAGATVRTAPILRWRAAGKARFYNVQVFRRGHKVLTAWPSQAHLRLHARWTFHGRQYRLRPGTYTWLVWPAYGTPSKPRYGSLLGVSSFVFAR